MPETFDPYHRWLGIPPEEQPPGYYRLLGVKLFESDADVIDSAVNRQMAHLRTFQGGPHAALSQRLLNEVATARVCLLNPTKKAAYDNSLRPAPRIVSAARLSSTPASPPPLPTRAVNLVQAAVGDAEADSEEPFDIAGLVQQAKRVPKRSAQPAEAGRPGGDERKKARISPTAIGAIVAGSLVLGALILFLIMLIATKPAEPTVAAKTGPSQSPPSANESAPSRHAVPAKSSSSTSAAGPTDASHSEPSGKRASPTGAPPPSKPESNDTVDVTANPKAIQEAARLSEQRALDGQDTVLKASYAASVAEKAKLLAKASAIFEEIRPRFVDALNASVSLRDSPGPGTTREDARIMVGENRLTLAMVDFYLAQTQQSGPARTAALTTCIKEFDDIYQDHRERFVGWRAHVWHARILQELGQPSDAKDIYKKWSPATSGISRRWTGARRPYGRGH